MLAKYKIEYGVKTGDYVIPNHYETDDPVTCQQFLSELLRHSFRIKDIKHEGVSISRTDFDSLVKKAASVLAADQVCAALDIKPEEERYRFGFAA